MSINTRSAVQRSGLKTKGDSYTKLSTVFDLISAQGSYKIGKRGCLLGKQEINLKSVKRGKYRNKNDSRFLCKLTLKQNQFCQNIQISKHFVSMIL